MSAPPPPPPHQEHLRQQLHLQQNYCNILPPTSDFDPTYASIDDCPHSFLHSNTSWMSTNSSGLDDDYTNHLRTSSYALLAAGPESLLQQERERWPAQPGPASRAGLRTSVFQSLPYMAASQVRLMTIFT